MRPAARLVVLTVLLAFAGAAFAGAREDQRASDAVIVLDNMMMVPEQALPEAMLREAQAIAVFPNVVKAGLVIGGRRGHGLISVRMRDGTWSNPSFITLTGGSIGFQAGVQASDLVLVFRSQRGVDSIVNGKFTLGADAAVAAGPVGRMAQASTDEQLKAEIYAYARARGLFAGLAIDGAVMSINHRANQAVYGANTTPRAIFENRVGPSSTPIVDFRDRLEEYSAVAAGTSAPAPAPTPAQPAPQPAGSQTYPVQGAQTQPLQAAPAPQAYPQGPSAAPRTITPQPPSQQGFEPVPPVEELPEEPLRRDPAPAGDGY
ncbi:lipid-binding SYLF domain-containing protein [Coralloluteibacterium stylophorae]|uniref:Lipid-binding SYLF domain-containing protein n=1 Tax=Coralloluteibacterium stylophorae TaxID=1776034 RepID=A0A8J7VUA1_9GAMM|nr:lipid-binding SYLF domain-containing protein [Coralloluteibacterium stylophorae]MBS7457116.1 lipid-binding SYLF domain-containing protein [Coralloluteibacterium stylophorae]